VVRRYRRRNAAKRDTDLGRALSQKRLDHPQRTTALLTGHHARKVLRLRHPRFNHGLRGVGRLAPLRITGIFHCFESEKVTARETAEAGLCDNGTGVPVRLAVSLILGLVGGPSAKAVENKLTDIARHSVS